MDRQQLEQLGPEFSVSVGSESIAVHGSPAVGWTIANPESAGGLAYRYTTIEELVFVLINLSIALDGDPASA
jgi:hypothetical protein